MDIKNPQGVRVVYLLTKLELGGAQKVCLELFRGVRKSDIHTTLVSGAGGVLVDYAQQFDSVYLLPTFTREISIRGVWNEIRTFIAIVRLLRKFKKQTATVVVHTHSTKAGLIGRWAAFVSRVPYRVHTIHGYGFHDHQPWLVWFPIYLLELVTSLITTHFVCVSDQDRKTGMRLFPFFGHKSSLIRAAVDWELFNGARAESDAITAAVKVPDVWVIGTVACFKPQKNLFDLLWAFKVVHQVLLQRGEMAPRLEIIGDGALRGELEAWIQNEGLATSVFFLGWQDNVAHWMRSWNIFALSSLWEGLPCAVIEARLSRLPVVAYDVGGIKEVINHGKNGFLVAPKDRQGLADCLLSIISNPLLYHSLMMQRDVLSDFHNQTMVKKHQELYKNIVNSTL